MLVFVVDKNKEKNQTDDSKNQGDEAEKKALTGTNTVGLGVSSHFSAGYAHPVIILASVSVNTHKIL